MSGQWVSWPSLSLLQPTMHNLEFNTTLTKCGNVLLSAIILNITTLLRYEASWKNISIGNSIIPWGLWWRQSDFFRGVNVGLQWHTQFQFMTLRLYCHYIFQSQRQAFYICEVEAISQLDNQCSDFFKTCMFDCLFVAAHCVWPLHTNIVLFPTSQRLTL